MARAVVVPGEGARRLAAAFRRVRLARLAVVLFSAFAAGLIGDALREDRLFLPRRALPEFTTIPAP